VNQPKHLDLAKFCATEGNAKSTLDLYEGSELLPVESIRGFYCNIVLVY
jgi:hypothetical protein